MPTKDVPQSKKEARLEAKLKKEANKRNEKKKREERRKRADVGEFEIFQQQLTRITV